MKKKLLIVVGIVLSIIVLVALVNYVFYSKDKVSQNDYAIIGVLESQVLPFVQKNGVSYFFDSDWCQVLVKNDELFSNTIESTSDQDCGIRLTGIENASEFGEEQKALLNETKTLLNDVSGKEFVRINTEKPLTSESEHISYPQSEIGIAFHLDCDFCRTRYVYWQGYDELPPNIESEIKYIPINENWYRVEQDWN